VAAMSGAALQSGTSAANSRLTPTQWPTMQGRSASNITNSSNNAILLLSHSQPTQAAVYVAKFYQSESTYIDYTEDVSATTSSDASHEFSPTPGIVDSGANISVTNEKTYN